MMENIFKSGKQVSYVRGDRINVADTVYYITQGSAAMYSTDTRVRKLLFIYHADTGFPYYKLKNSLFSGRKIEFIALDTVFMLALSREEFLKEAFKPENIHAYAESMAYRIDSLYEIIDQLSVGNARQRIILRLIYLAKRLGRPHGDKIIVDMPLSHADIAESVGTTRETVNRTMSELEREEIVSRRHQTVMVNSIEKLHQKVVG